MKSRNIFLPVSSIIALENSDQFAFDDTILILEQYSTAILDSIPVDSYITLVSKKGPWSENRVRPKEHERQVLREVRSLYGLEVMGRDE